MLFSRCWWTIHLFKSLQWFRVHKQLVADMSVLNSKTKWLSMLYVVDRLSISLFPYISI